MPNHVKPEGRGRMVQGLTAMAHTAVWHQFSCL